MNRKIDWYAIIIGFCFMGVFILWDTFPKVTIILGLTGSIIMVLRTLRSKFKQRRYNGR